MTIFDLLFLVLAPTALLTLLRALYLLVRGRRRQGLRVLKWLGASLAVYLGIVVAVALLTPRRVLAIGEDRCFDDWCVAVEQAAAASQIGSTAAQGKFYIVTLRVSSRALRVSQRAPDAAAQLEDGEGRTYYPSPAGQHAYETQNGATKSMGDLIEPEGSFHTVRVFDVPMDATHVGLVVRHGGGPGMFIIGDDQHPLHKSTIVPLNVP